MIGEIEQALDHLLHFLRFDRCTFGEFLLEDGRLNLPCSIARSGVEPRLLGPSAQLPWYIETLRASRQFVSTKHRERQMKDSAKDEGVIQALLERLSSACRDC